MSTGKVSDEREVKVPATEAWKLYGTLQLAKLVQESLPTVVTKADVLEGDGGPGTIVHVHFPPPPGTDAAMSHKEKFTVVDDEKRVKVAEVVEGGFLDLGFTLYRVRFEVLEKKGVENECITKTTVEYEVREEAAAYACLVSIQPFSAIMQCAADYLVNNYKYN